MKQIKKLKEQIVIDEHQVVLSSSSSEHSVWSSDEIQIPIEEQKLE